MAASGGSVTSGNMAVTANGQVTLVVRELSPADYPDGWDDEGIAAGSKRVNRKYGKWLYGTSGFNRTSN